MRGRTSGQLMHAARRLLFAETQTHCSIQIRGWQAGWVAHVQVLLGGILSPLRENGDFRRTAKRRRRALLQRIGGFKSSE